MRQASIITQKGSPLSAPGVVTPGALREGAPALASSGAPGNESNASKQGVSVAPEGAPDQSTAGAPSRSTGMAVAYIRVSTRRQTDGDGPARQLKAISAAAATLGVKVAARFQEAVSGKVRLDPEDEEDLNRIALAECLDYCKKQRVGIVLIERPDRLARELVAQELAVQKFQKAGIRIICADGLQDLTQGDDSNPMIRMIRQIIGAVAEFDRAMITSRLRAARDRIRQKYGRCGGVPRFGSDVDEQAAIKAIARLTHASRGSSLARIAKELDSMGIRPRVGTRWSRSSVHKVIRRLRGDVVKGGQP